MPKITIDPEVLEKKAGEIERLSERLSKLTGRINNVCLLAGSHDGQFKPRVVQLAGQMNSKIMQSSARTSQSSEGLKKISNKFKAADSQNRSKNIWQTEIRIPQWIKDFISKVNQEISYSLEGLLALGILYDDTRTKLRGEIRNSICNLGRPTWLLINRNARNEFALEFSRLIETKPGREIISKTIAAGLLFVLVDPNGKTLAQLGNPKTATQQILVTFTKDKPFKGAYFYDEKKIYINLENKKDPFFYKEVLVHEMQHAIDDKLDEIEGRRTGFPSNFKGMDKGEITSIIQEMVESSAKSEIRAFDIGFENANKQGEIADMLNRHDGVYTKEEFDYVLFEKGNANRYKEFAEKLLSESFPDGPNYLVRIEVNDDGKIQVSLDEQP